MRIFLLLSLILASKPPGLLFQNTAETQPVTQAELTTITATSQTTLTTSAVAPLTTTPSWISTIPNFFQVTLWCRSTNSLGRFPPVDPTTGTATGSINGYFYCYIYNGTIFGQYYECPGRTVFNSTLQLCSPGRANTYLGG